MKYLQTSGNEFYLDWHIPYFLCDEELVLTLPGLIHMWTDTSIMHYEAVYTPKEKDHKVWMVYSWDIRFERFPVAHTKVKTVTFPYEYNRFFAKRNFLLLDEEDNILAYADSVWLLVDVEKQRPGRIDGDLFNSFGETEAFYTKPRPKLQELDHYSERRSLSPRKTDIDSNHHVNNASIIDWFNEVNVDFVGDYASLSSFIICYEKQIFMDDEPVIEMEKIEDNKILARIVAGGTTRVTAEATFKDNTELKGGNLA